MIVLIMNKTKHMNNDIKVNSNYRRIQKQARRREMIINVVRIVGLALLGLFIAWLLVVGLWAIN